MVVNQVDAYPWVQSLSLLKSTYQRYVLLLWVCKPCALFCEQAFRLCPNVALRFSAPSSKYLYTCILILYEPHLACCLICFTGARWCEVFAQTDVLLLRRADGSLCACDLWFFLGWPLMYALLELYSLLLDGGDDGANKQGLELPLQYFWEWS